MRLVGQPGPCVAVFFPVEEEQCAAREFGGLAVRLAARSSVMVGSMR